MSVGRIFRLLRVITLLQGGRYPSADDLARELEVSRRTVFRDLNVLEMAHIPYFFDEIRGGYRINSNFFLPPVNLTLSEALSLLTLAHQVVGEQGLAVLGEAARAAAKLEGVLPAAIRDECGSFLEAVRVDLARHVLHDQAGVYERMQQAILNRRCVRCTYKAVSSEGQIDTTLAPYRLWFAERAWYVVGHSSAHDEIRVFKLIRFQTVKPTDKPFVLPADFRLEDVFGAAWRMIREGKVRHISIVFEPLVATNVAEVRWHPSQKLSWLDDGRLRFEANVDGLAEITWWVLGYGDQATVEKPAELRKRIVGTVRRMLGRYGKKG